MDKNILSSLTDEQLLDEKKKMNTAKLINAILIGMMVGVSFYSIVKNGISFWAFFPLIFAFILLRNRNRFKNLEEELEIRNLK